MAAASSLSKKAPLFRKINTTAHRPGHHGFGDFRDNRHSKAFASSDAHRAPMHPRQQGLDYKPLFRFLLSKVGQPWDAVHAEAVARLDKADPIFWLVARQPDERKDVVRVGESSYFNGLYVDEAGLLRKVADVALESLKPTCVCCTHTFNGKQFTRKYAAPDAPA